VTCGTPNGLAAMMITTTQKTGYRFCSSYIYWRKEIA
jgi:hypothetical protein